MSNKKFIFKESFSHRKNKKRHKGIHAKSKQSNIKGSKLYKKPYNRQGK